MEPTASVKAPTPASTPKPIASPRGITTEACGRFSTMKLKGSVATECEAALLAVLNCSSVTFGATRKSAQSLSLANGEAAPA